MFRQTLNQRLISTASVASLWLTVVWSGSALAACGIGLYQNLNDGSYIALESWEADGIQSASIDLVAFTYDSSGRLKYKLIESVVAEKAPVVLAWYEASRSTGRIVFTSGSTYQPILQGIQSAIQGLDYSGLVPNSSTLRAHWLLCDGAPGADATNIKYAVSAAGIQPFDNIDIRAQTVNGGLWVRNVNLWQGGSTTPAPPSESEYTMRTGFGGDWVDVRTQQLVKIVGMSNGNYYAYYPRSDGTYDTRDQWGHFFAFPMDRQNLSPQRNATIWSWRGYANEPVYIAPRSIRIGDIELRR